MSEILNGKTCSETPTVLLFFALLPDASFSSPIFPVVLLPSASFSSLPLPLCRFMLAFHGVAHAPIFLQRGGAADRWRIRPVLLRGEERERKRHGKPPVKRRVVEEGRGQTKCVEGFLEETQGVAETEQHQLQLDQPCRQLKKRLSSVRGPFPGLLGS